MADILVGRSDAGRGWVERLVDAGDGTHAQAVVLAMAPASAATLDAAVANADAVVTLAATAGKCHYLPRVVWSYSDDPDAGRLTVTVGGATVLDVDIMAGGPGFLPLGIVSEAGDAVVATLAAGGAGVTGKIALPGARTS